MRSEFELPAGRRRGSLTLGAMLPALLAVVIVAFPKAGIPAGGVPFNFSTLIGLPLAAIGWLYAAASVRRPIDMVGAMMILLALLTWTGGFNLALAHNRIPLRDVAMMMFAMAAVFGLGLAPLLRRMPGAALRTIAWIRYAVVFLLAYALLQIAFGAETVAINYVTAIYGVDFDEVLNKHNMMRSLGTYKIFATYQNGNMFSTGLILTFPLALYSLRSLPQKLVLLAVFNLVIVYTASFSAYVGAVVINIMFFVTHQRRIAVYIPAMALSAVIGGWLYFSQLCSGATNCALVNLLTTRAVNRNLSENERWDKVADWAAGLNDAPLSLFLGEIYQTGPTIREVFLFSVAQNFGVIVLALMLVFMFMYIRPLRVRFYKAGFYAYMISSFGESAFWATPTAFIIGIMLAIVHLLDTQEDMHKAAAARPPARAAPA